MFIGNRKSKDTDHSNFEPNSHRSRSINRISDDINSYRSSVYSSSIGSTVKSSLLESHVNDDEEMLIQEVKRERTDTSFVQMKKVGGITRKIMLSATLVTDPTKRILVETTVTDTIRNLQVIIGIEMQSRFQDQFQFLDNVRAFNITKEKDKFLEFRDSDLVGDFLDDEDHVYFEISSSNFWLHVNFKLYNQQKMMLQGTTAIKVNKKETIFFLRKQLQIIMIHVWSQL